MRNDKELTILCVVPNHNYWGKNKEDNPHSMPGKEISKLQQRTTN